MTSGVRPIVSGHSVRLKYVGCSREDLQPRRLQQRSLLCVAAHIALRDCCMRFSRLKTLVGHVMSHSVTITYETY